MFPACADAAEAPWSGSGLAGRVQRTEMETWAVSAKDQRCFSLAQEGEHQIYREVFCRV